jgi:hypothetical protein
MSAFRRRAIAICVLAGVAVACGGSRHRIVDNTPWASGDGAVCDALLSQSAKPGDVRQLASTTSNSELRAIAAKGGLTAPGVTADEVRRVHEICAR